MLSHWIAFDPGARTLRFYDYENEKVYCIDTSYCVKDERVIALGKDVCKYVYENPRVYQVKYPLDQQHLVADITPLVKKAFKKLNVFSCFFKSCVLLACHNEVNEEQRLAWQESLLSLGVRKVEFVDNTDLLQEEDPCMFIHAGHSYTEIGIYAYHQEFAHKIIYFSGSVMDEKIKTILAQKQNCLISNEDASALKEAVSQAFRQNKNPMLQCTALDRFGKATRVEIRAGDLWPAMEEVIKQIVLWAQECFQSMGVDMKEHLRTKGIYLSGGLAHCFGLKEALQHAFDCPIICTKTPEYVMIEQMKGLK